MLRALYALGGTAPVAELENRVADMLGLSLAEKSEIHKGKVTRLSYRIAWSRFHLKKKGFLESSKRGVSVLSETGKQRAAGLR